MALSELNRRRWRNFRRNGRAFWSLVIFSVLFVLAMFAEVVANDKPIVANSLNDSFDSCGFTSLSTQNNAFAPTVRR